MRLMEALEVLQRPVNPELPALRLYLGCGFTPLDLATFAQAHARLRSPGRAVHLTGGLYGDLAGSLERIDPAAHDAVLVALEWADLDARLGFRSLGGWLPDSLGEVANSAGQALERLAAAVERLAAAIPVALTTPTLPLPPLFLETPGQAGAVWWTLQDAVTRFAQRLSGHARVRLVHPEAIGRDSTAARLDLKSDLAAGFPYRKAHAEVVARHLVAAALPVPPRKGIITDLDDTLWAGILGDAGVSGVAWDLEHHAQRHGLYQQTLASLAASGVLIGVASKNDAALARQALERPDLGIGAAHLFPVEANWGPKSESVRRILAAWNIAADSVVFIDDSPMELAEVAAAHPGLETIAFPKDPDALLAMLWMLRDRFGKHAITEEDRLRGASLRTAAGQWNQAAGVGGAGAEDFLAGAEAVVTFDGSNPPADGRALELVNKTNQFNLDGRRWTDSEWSALLARPGAFVAVVSYRDRFGPLGRIGVLAGQRQAGRLTVSTWVLSCRAFSRRIEHRCLEYLFDTLGAGTIELPFQRTGRNGPAADFMATLTGGLPPEGQTCRIDRAQFAAVCPPLYHRLEVLSHV